MIELYQHNKEAYDNVLKSFETTNKTCVIHPTGTGKSFIALKWLYENKNKKCLFLTSTEVIIDQFIRYIGKSGLTLDDFPNLEIKTYHSLNDNNNNYDCIVLDEFHRCGAPIWGKEVNKILNNNKTAKVLGISATPIRYLDNGRDMSEEIFEGNISSKMSLAQAIARGILPVPIYINCIYSFKEDIEKIQKKIDKCLDIKAKTTLQNRLDKAKEQLENVVGLEDIFYKYFPKSGKFVVFCKDKQHMRQMQEEAKKWFSKINKNINIGEVCYDIPEANNKYTIDRFNNAKSDDINLLFSVDMLIEGLHIEETKGVIMLRPTMSLIIYLQQLGRGLSTCKGTPYIFDIVNNSDAFYAIYDFQEELQIAISEEKQKTNNPNELDRLDSILKQFKVIDEYRKIVDILDNIYLDATFTWDDWYKLAKNYYESNGHLIVPHRFKTKNGITEDEQGYNLGNWILNQRYKHELLSDIRIEMLNEIGMIWNNINDVNFNRWYSLAKNYYNQYGHLNVPFDFKTTDGVNEDSTGIELGKIISQKRREKVSSKVKEALDEIEMIWDLREFNQNIYYELAKNYYNHYGHLDIKNNFITKDGITEDEEGIKLGRWIQRLRADYNNKKLSPEEIDRMNELEMIWGRQDKIWNDYYKLAKYYFDHIGNLNLKSRFKTSNGIDYDPNGIALGGWLQRQKNDYINNRLSSKRIQKLEQIGIIWNVKEDNLLKSQIDSKNIDEITEYLCKKLNTLLKNHYEFNSKKDIEDLNEKLNDSIYIAKRK